MTDTAGTPPEPERPVTEDSGAQDAAESPPGTGSASAAEAGAAATGAGPQPGTADGDTSRTGAGTAGAGPEAAASHRKRRWVRWAAGGAALVVLAAAGTGWWFYQKLDGNITTDTGVAAELHTWEKERPAQAEMAMDAQNILLIGSDTRAGDNSKYGRDEGTQRSDTTILLHLAADRSSATAVSLPRDLMVDIPTCTKADGSRTRAMFAQFNWAFQMGGTACTIRTVEKLTGIRLDHHMVVDFEGFKDMVDAVDGVAVCLKEPIDDHDAHLKLAAGPQTLNGEQALGYVRARKSIGGGSDTERMDRQQQFLASLVNKMQSTGVLLNPTKLYPVLDAATKSLTTDPGLASLRDLYDLATSMRDVPSEKVQFMTVPRRPYRYNTNRDELVTSQADVLFRQLREDTPVSVTPNKSRAPGETPVSDEKPDDPGPADPTPSPTFTGTNAATGMCE
ncbi:LCP family protein [Streptomyces candidus]|uniref:LCP family protein required for cell wall assembly n=1 Tax=Streptomyces candidus TaxID=67283 RepID=A0A7X0LND0_9ACTN|nr:LCP family protein required for cell wall assembly [Streptomyces candidus]